MTRTKRIVYWIATLWLGLGMASTGIVQLIPLEEEVQKMNELGYPLYFLRIIGTWKLLGVAAVLVPGFPLVKEWAYAGFFFVMTGAIVSHLVHASPAMEFFGPVLLLVLTVTSWYCRPPERRLTAN